MGVYSPGEGQRRVDSAMQARDERIAELEEANVEWQGAYAKLQNLLAFVTGEKQEVAKANQALQSDLEIADGVAEMYKVKTAADKAAATMPLRVPSLWETTDPRVNKACANPAVSSTDRSSQVS